MYVNTCHIDVTFGKAFFIFTNTIVDAKFVSCNVGYVQFQNSLKQFLINEKHLIVAPEC